MRAAAGDVCGKRCTGWGEPRVADAPGSSRKGDQGSEFPKRVLCERYAGSSPAWGTVFLRTSSNGRTAVFQTADVGSIPAVRSEPILREERGLQDRISLSCRKQAPVYEAGCRGSTPRREADLLSVTTSPPSWRIQARASEARHPGLTPGGGAAAARVVEQHARIALSLTEHAIVLDRGRIVHRGASQALLDAPDLLHRLMIGEPDAETGATRTPT